MKWVNALLLSCSMFLGLSCSSVGVSPEKANDSASKEKKEAKSIEDLRHFNWPLDINGR